MSTNGVINGFNTVMKKRDANIRAFENFDRAFMKYCTPRWIHGTTHGKQVQVCADEKVICRIQETEICWICNWKGDILIPYWRVEVIRDISDITRNMKHLFIEAPNYQIGFRGTTGPMVATTPHYHEIRTRPVVPARNNGQPAPARG